MCNIPNYITKIAAVIFKLTSTVYFKKNIMYTDRDRNSNWDFFNLGNDTGRNVIHMIISSIICHVRWYQIFPDKFIDRPKYFHLFKHNVLRAQNLKNTHNLILLNEIVGKYLKPRKEIARVSCSKPMENIERV